MSVKAKLIVISILLALVCCSPQLASGFWLTDGSLFQTASSPAASIEVDRRQSAAPEVAATTAAAPSVVAATQAAVAADLLANTLVATNRLEAAAKLASPASSGQQPLSSGGGNQCQCDADWLQRQTGALLAKWLASPNFANQMRSFILSNSSGPAAAAVRRATDTKAGGGNHATGGWSRAKGGAAATRSAAWAESGAGNSSATAPAGGARPARAKWHSAGQNPKRRQQQPIKLVAGERGPKGDAGPRGERGPAGLAVVRDRDALFELAGAGEQVVFLEAEQVLVVNTSLGWRPVPLLAPLRRGAARKAVAKTSTSSQSSGGGGGQSVEWRKFAAPVAGGNTGPSGGGDDKLGRGNRLNVVDSNGGGDDDDSDDDDNNNIRNADEDDDQSDADDDDDSDDDDDDDDDDEEDDDDDDDDDGNELAGAKVSGAADGDDDDDKFDGSNELVGGGRKGLRVAAERGGERAKRRRAQVTGRSALAPAVGAHMDNSIAFSRANLNQVEPSDASRLKLRLVALNEPLSGNVHGLRGAHYKCKQAAARANIKGAFRAFLATNYQSLNEIVRSAATSNGQKVPIVNLRGETLASSWADLFRQPARLTNPLSRIYSFDGRHVASDPNWPNKLVWHGAGNKFGHSDQTLHNCDDWHSDSLSKFGFATPLHLPRNYQHHRAQRQLGAAAKRLGQQRRFVDEAGRTNSSLDAPSAITGNDVLDAIEKYPCRMPLIVLCVETIAQAS